MHIDVDTSQALCKAKQTLQINKIHYKETSYLIVFEDVSLTVYYAFNQTFVCGVSSASK